MTGTEYERWCARELERLGFRNVRLTRASHDQGIDLTAEDKGIRWGFQCKYYAGSVGNDAVQQVYAGMKYYGLDRAAVLCGGTFTAPAEQLAEQTGIELWDHFAPRQTSRASLLLRVPAGILLVYFLYLFFQLMKDPYVYQAEMTILAFGVIGCLVIAAAAEHTGALVFAMLCLVVPALSGLMNPLFRIAAVGCVFMVLLCAIRTVVIARVRMIENAEGQKEELRELIEQTRSDLAREVRNHLEDTLNQPVRVMRTVFDRDDTMHMTCRVRGSLDDLAVCEYALNQQARFEKAEIRFRLERIDDRTFTATLCRKD